MIATIREKLKDEYTSKEINDFVQNTNNKQFGELPEKVQKLE